MIKDFYGTQMGFWATLIEDDLELAIELCDNFQSISLSHEDLNEFIKWLIEIKDYVGNKQIKL